SARPRPRRAGRRTRPRTPGTPLPGRRRSRPAGSRSAHPTTATASPQPPCPAAPAPARWDPTTTPRPASPPPRPAAEAAAGVHQPRGPRVPAPAPPPRARRRSPPGRPVARAGGWRAPARRGSRRRRRRPAGYARRGPGAGPVSGRATAACRQWAGGLPEAGGRGRRRWARPRLDRPGGAGSRRRDHWLVPPHCRCCRGVASDLEQLGFLVLEDLVDVCHLPVSDLVQLPLGPAALVLAGLPLLD